MSHKARRRSSWKKNQVYRWPKGYLWKLYGDTAVVWLNGVIDKLEKFREENPERYMIVNERVIKFMSELND